ncbi:hypothetical protein M422DRAFT_235875 [Sphaerobolus stellatus SS14]|uniref:Peroxisomal ATPase PEX6 n=1 Tax=Sphaerobolus stellatus (strain SS14) TaxID=990650 RepID=A0A0C9TEV2_SPHS4|nr:hypothetical protein M422DRAFT_235875 [Sphaerobolus stellatus SS14]
MPSHKDITHISKFQVLMTEPTLQGIAIQDYTRFIVIPGSEDFEEPDSSLNGDSASSLGSEASTELFSESDVDELVIDEAFLANGVIPPLPRTPSSETPNKKLNDDDTYFVETSPEFRRPGTLPHISLRAEPLSISLANPRVEDPESRIFLKSADLSRIRLFDGDWGVVGDDSHSEFRLCRIFARDKLITKAGSQTLASPILLANIQPSQRPSNPLTISIRPSVFGSRSPTIPVARSVAVARVASPYSNDKTYQPFFLNALKDYFEGKKRLVKKGDLIAVPLEIELAKLAHGRERDKEASQKNDEKEENKSHDDIDDLLGTSLPLSSKNPATAVVFFKITNLEYDIVDTVQDGAALDHYTAATMGELGCWVDTQVTKMVQTGVENSWVPDVISYLGLATDAPQAQPYDFSDSDPTRPITKLRDLAEAAMQPSAVEYGLQLSVLLRGSRGIGKLTNAAWVARSLGVHLYEISCFDLVGETDVQTEGTLRARFEKATSCAPCIFVLRHIEALARTTQVLETGKEPAIASALQECIADLGNHWKSTSYPVLVMATTSEPERVPASVLASFKHEIVFEVPNETERLTIINNLLANVSLSPDISLKNIATQTAAMVASDLVNLIELAQSTALKRTMLSPPPNHTLSEQATTHAGVALTASDLDTALSAARLSFSESIGAPKIPNVSWDDVGGLANVKSEILDTIQLPLEHPELFADGLKKRSGILLYGPPGTGKTLLAKAVATSCSLNFFSVKGPELLNMYIGESEANVRRVFQRARDAKPCVIFFDELDSVAPKRGNHGDSGGVMDRIVSQLLAELDGMADSANGADVFVIGATNRPDLLDSALLRPGRFDRMLYLGVSDNHDAQHNILQALTRKFRKDPALDLFDIAQQCPFNYTGADFYALCSDAMLKAMARKAEEVDAKITELNSKPPPYAHPHPITPQYYLAEMATAEETDVLVSRRDFEEALKELVPSVSQEEMVHYRAVQHRFANETMNSDMNQAKQEAQQNGHKQEDEDDAEQLAVQIELPPPSSSKGKGKARGIDE